MHNKKWEKKKSAGTCLFISSLLSMDRVVLGVHKVPATTEPPYLFCF